MTLRPDAQGFDEVRIVTVPRYKTSGMSGDEWRISGEIQLMRKGRIVHKEQFQNVESCAKFLPWVMACASDNGKAYFASEEDFCDQEGCSEKAVSKYRLKAEYCRKGHKTELPAYAQQKDQLRQFCAKHLKRGDCGLEDNDDNYEVVSGPGPKDNDWNGSHISESAQVMVNVQSIDQIGDAVAQVIKDKAREPDRH